MVVLVLSVLDRNLGPFKFFLISKIQTNLEKLKSSNSWHVVRQKSHFILPTLVSVPRHYKLDHWNWTGIKNKTLGVCVHMLMNQCFWRNVNILPDFGATLILSNTTWKWRNYQGAKNTQALSLYNFSTADHISSHRKLHRSGPADNYFFLRSYWNSSFAIQGLYKVPRGESQLFNSLNHPTLYW